MSVYYPSAEFTTVLYDSTKHELLRRHQEKPPGRMNAKLALRRENTRTTTKDLAKVSNLPLIWDHISIHLNNLSPAS
ncbi:hypothetical protein PYCCODRAFT_1212292 [Trametes coccinea BRFM310]|uniref:Uncharacterized protein n=1 Tax=Trametes coccinea (strain BRFM310) TaxID=1353009 RepID=A0A1Y2I8T0_TRAC3|nr:hypothetical protein PYCCODRAFT_1212292 [Trametes coccinea BRFM310]